MSFETAKSIIDKDFGCEYERGIICFMGGEPFLNFSLLKAVVAYVLENYPNVTFEAFTNGTLIKGSIADWLIGVRDVFDLVLSLDGDRTSHDFARVYKNGKGSFDDIDLKLMHEKLGLRDISITISNDTMAYLSKNIEWIQRNGYHCQALFAMGVKWNRNVINECLGREMSLLSDFYIKNPEQKLCLFLRYHFNQFHAEIPAHYRICRIGQNPCYAPCGNRSLCTGLSEITIGDDTEKFRLYKPDDFCSQTLTCTACKFALLCRGVKLCYVSNYQATGNFFKVSDEQCFINKVCIWTSAYIEENRILRSGENINKKDADYLCLLQDVMKNIKDEMGCDEICDVKIGGSIQ